MYHYISVEIVMRNCKSAEDAKKKCEALLPQYPDENTVYMESWEITRAASPFAVSPLPPKV